MAKAERNLWERLRHCTAREARVFLATREPQFFAKEYLGITLYQHHLDWIAMAADPASSPRVLIEAPKDHGKSWALGFVFLLWRLMKDLNLWTTYVSNTAQQAEMHARPVIYQLETNKKLIEDFSYGGSFRPPAIRRVSGEIERLSFSAR